MDTAAHTVAVTGATGFLGSHLCEQLAGAGASVVGVVRSPEKGRWLEPLGVDLRRADLADVDALAAAFAGCDTVVANAALAPGWAKHDDEAFVRANVDGARNHVDAAARVGARHLVLISSVAVYQTRLGAVVTERSPLRDPDRSGFDWSRLTTDVRYARTKAAAERIVRAGCDRAGIALTVLRPGPIYGPRDHKVTARYGRYLRGRVRAAPTLRLPHVHAGDVARAVVAALASPGGTYNVTGPSVSLLELLRTWRRIAGTGPRLVPIPVPLAVAYDNNAVERDLGLRFRSLEEGLTDSVAWFTRSAG